ncbi:helix-turn-helix transcriptional regulator [Streptomyces sp. NPDC049837]|uniref:helix-turn-helix transcriptional regulator n=1 Tax=Streptomyces sp. NPDC049837 TaxID=3155277 RepID=UPI0034323C8F
MGRQGELAPHRARDAAEFVALLRELKERSGLTYRQLEERAAAQGEVLPRSTLAGVLSGGALPRPELLATFVRTCGDGVRVTMWLQARARVADGQTAEAGGAGEAGEAGKAEPARPRPLFGLPRLPRLPRRPRLPRKGAAAAVSVAAVLVAVGAWMLAAPDEPGATPGEDRSPVAALSGAGPALGSGWVRIRPVTAPSLCLTDGRVRDRRHTPLVAVQRPCDEAMPQATRLEPMGGDAYRIQWHHPDYGKGCLKALSEGPGEGLLEPYDDCAQGSRFHLEPSGPYGGGRYVLRVDGQGCVGIKNSDTSEGTEAVMERCVGRGGQVFLIETVP